MSEQTLKEKVFNLLFPPRCTGCFREGVFLCEECFRTLPILPSVQCPVCGRRIFEGRVCARCRAASGLHRFVAASSYDHPIVAQAIHDMKYRFIRELSWPLAKLLCDAARIFWPYDLTPDCSVLAMPLAKPRLRWRGFNQSLLLADHFAKHVNRPLLPQEGPDAIFRRIKHGKPQMLLKQGEREENIRGAFFVPRPDCIARKVVVLVDDVMTSGATMFEAAKTLREAGAKEVWGAVVARG